MNKSTWAKIFGWFGGTLTSVGAALAAGGTGNLKLIGVVASIVGGLLTGTGVHQASQTSAGHPNG